MNNDAITVLRNEFCTIIDNIADAMLCDESIVKKACELEKKLFECANANN